MHGNGVDLIEAHASSLKRFVDDWQQALKMRAGGDLRNDAAEARVQVDLRRDNVRQDSQFVGEDSGSGFVTRRFDGQKKRSLHHTFAACGLETAPFVPLTCAVGLAKSCQRLLWRKNASGFSYTTLRITSS